MDQVDAVSAPPSDELAGSWPDFVHTGPGTLAGRYLRAFWQPVYHSCDLAPGDAKPLNLFGDTFTIYRGVGGGVHLVDPFCPHRGLRLSVGHVEGDAIRCLYHAWKFEHDGRCIEQPAEDAPFCERIRIRSYPVREYLGFVFAYLGEGAPPEFPRHPEFEYFDGMLEIDSYQRNCNYFQNIDNALDHCHLQFVHGNVARKALDTVVMGRSNRIDESEWGLTLTSPRADGQAFISQFGMPNMLTVAALPIDADMGWKESLFWWVPIDDQRHMQFGINTVRASGEAAERIYQKRQARRRTVDQPHQWLAEEILAGRSRLQDADGDRCDLVKLQDNVAQVGQMRIVDRRLEHLGASDLGVVKLRRLWRRELQAFGDGRPLQSWKKTPKIRPSVWGFGATPVDPSSGAKPRIVDVRPFVEVELQLKTLSEPLR